MRGLILVAFLASVVGCAGQHQQLQEEQWATGCQQKLVAAIDEFRAAINGNKRLDPIRDKINLTDPQGPTVAMLSLTGVPSYDEKRAIEEWLGRQQGFRSELLSLFQQCSPWEIPLFELVRAAALTSLADLYSGKIDYGEYNRQRFEITTRWLQARQERAQEIQRQQVQASQAQAQITAQQSLATSAALSTFRNYLIGEQLINQQTQPARIVPFTCTQFGDITNCY